MRHVCKKEMNSNGLHYKKTSIDTLYIRLYMLKQKFLPHIPVSLWWSMDIGPN